jgi:hypothetical protein
MKKSMVVAAVLMTTVVSGMAQGKPGWQFEVTPYAWLAGFEGDMTIGGETVEFEKSFEDLVDAVEVGASLRIGAEYNRFMMGALVDYFSMSTDELDVEDRPAGGSLDTKLLLTEVAVGYRVNGWSEGQSFGLMVGVRNMHIEGDLEIYGHGTTSGERDVTDAMFYVLPSMPVFPSKIKGLRFNPILGIGAGDSDLVYELFPQFQYQFTDMISGRLGYRTAGWKFKGDNNEDNELNFSMSGLIAGIGMTF